MTDHRDIDDRADPIDAHEPIEKIEATDPALPTDRIEPTLPIDRIEPFDPMENNESSDHSDQRERGDLIGIAEVSSRRQAHHRDSPRSRASDTKREDTVGVDRGDAAG
jgi:hypothetical protein